MNGARFRQSNIFHDFEAVNATQPRRVSSLKKIFLSKLIGRISVEKIRLRWIFWFPGSITVALNWNIKGINEIPLSMKFTQPNKCMPNWNSHWNDGLFIRWTTFCDNWSSTELWNLLLNEKWQKIGSCVAHYLRQIATMTDTSTRCFGVILSFIVIVNEKADRRKTCRILWCWKECFSSNSKIMCLGLLITYHFHIMCNNRIECHLSSTTYFQSLGNSTPRN